jgi:hypothetical protein
VAGRLCAALGRRLRLERSDLPNFPLEVALPALVDVHASEARFEVAIRQLEDRITERVSATNEILRMTQRREC